MPRCCSRLLLGLLLLPELELPMEAPTGLGVVVLCTPPPRALSLLLLLLELLLELLLLLLLLLELLLDLLLLELVRSRR